MESRHFYILNSCLDLETRIQEHPPFNQDIIAEEEQDFLAQWHQLINDITDHKVDYSFLAQELIARFIRCYAHLTPLIRRELLWFIGGECLHFLGDEEIAFYQVFEEHMYELESKNQPVDIASELTFLRQSQQPDAIKH